jgi:ATP-dependent DNA helicase RecG
MQGNKSTPVQYLKRVGPKRAEALATAGLLTAADLLNYVPYAYIDRSSVSSLADLSRQLRKNDDLFDLHNENDIDIRSECTVVAHILSVQERHYGASGSKSMLIAKAGDESGGVADLVFFNNLGYYKAILKQGALFAISGLPEFDTKWKKLSFQHPELLPIDEEEENDLRNGVILPKYRLNQAMKSAHIGLKAMRSIMASAMEAELPFIHEVLPAYLLEKHKLTDRRKAFADLHAPQHQQAIIHARRRMKFEELFFFELLLAFRNNGLKHRESAPVIAAKSALCRQLLESLSFELTNAQKKAIWEIALDMESGKPMNRLLQGDVGSGKTIVSFFSMLMAVDSGYQTLIMAPTEILAEQHYHSAKKLLDPLGIEVVQLVGGQKVKTRREINEKISSGKAQIIVGTHALFGTNSIEQHSGTHYHKLGLIIVDEQHRFGVLQRAKLRQLATQSLGNMQETNQAIAPHILVMSATPIPRTLSMTVYGDLDVSVINEMPRGRKPIYTKIVFESQLPDIYQAIRAEIAKGHQAYIVYPLVEKSEKIEAKSAVEHFEMLSTEIFPDLKLGLLHGQMFWYEKEDTMKAFKAGEFHILVATTVVEVGIDIPNATLMLIENAERFGLAQLHQLRGRVGRGGVQSYCYLATKDHFKFQLSGIKAEQAAQARKATALRLKTMEQTTDGFKVAEADLALRGPGDVLGIRQSGMPEFRFTDLIEDGPVISLARNEAFSLIENDPHLRKPANSAVRQEFLRLYGNNNSFLDIA